MSDLHGGENVELPYAGTSGWSGSDTSRTRALTADQSGKTADHQRFVLAQLFVAQSAGLTWRELSDLTGWHHGVTSGVLSVLHKTGRIARLTEKRNRCAIYVALAHVDDRPIAPHGRRNTMEAVGWYCTGGHDGVERPYFWPLGKAPCSHAVVAYAAVPRG